MQKPTNTIARWSRAPDDHATPPCVRHPTHITLFTPVLSSLPLPVEDERQVEARVSALAHPLVAEHVDVLAGDGVDGLEEGAGGEQDAAPGVVGEALLARVHSQRQLLVEHLCGERRVRPEVVAEYLQHLHTTLLI